MTVLACASPHKSTEALGRSSPSIVFFGHDCVEPTIVKRVTAFLDAGSSVLGFMFQRERLGAVGPRVPCPMVDLGLTVDRHYLKRLPTLLLGAARALRRRDALRTAGVVYARNLDMVLVAWLAVKLAGGRGALVYEVLDVQRLMLKSGGSGRLARAAERFILRRCALLVVSSPEFVSNYFQPIQAYYGPWRLLENKVSSHLSHQNVRPHRRVSIGPPWVIGWFGTLRCSKSLEALTRIADTLGDLVRIEIRGRLSHEDIDPNAFHSALADRPNMRFGGPYENPRQLGEIYGAVHFSWSIDYLDSGANSDWLLPNRIYEGGLAGVPALARANTATGRYVVSHTLGWTLPEPIERTVCALLEGMTPDEYSAKQSAIMSHDINVFIDVNDTIGLLIDCELTEIHDKAVRVNSASRQFL